MSDNQKEAKLKASIADFVGPLLKRLKLAKEQVPDKDSEEIINQISTYVEKTKDIIVSRENWDQEITGYFGQIERQIDYWIDHNDKTTEWTKTVKNKLIIVHNNQLSRELTDDHPKAGTNSHEGAFELPQKATIFEVGESSNRSYQEHEFSMDQMANPPTADTNSREEASNSHQRAPIIEVGESSNRSYQEHEFSKVEECMESLDFQEQRCLYSLCVFPENKKLKKRLLIYWWIALGLVDTSRTTERGEHFFSYLVHKGVLVPKVIKEHNQVIDCCTIEPTIHKQLISFCEMASRFKSEEREEGTWHLNKDDEFNLKELLNVDQSYLNSKDISSKHDLCHDFQVVQLGSWYYKEPEVHIEVDETEFLNKLGAKVTYLSLRGISRIAELHESIGKLKDLLILDLKACHNLGNLPEKPRSTLKQKLIRWALPQESWWFKKLMILDISECYLIDHMPKWVCELSNLEVLKGFVVSRVGSKNQSCRVGDLSKLNKLRKLSIRIASEHLVKEDFSGLKPLDRLLVLTIIWGDNKPISPSGHGNKSNDTIDNKLISSSGHGNKSNDTIDNEPISSSGHNNQSNDTIDNKPISSSGHSNKSNDTIPTYYFPENLEKLDIRCYPEAEASELLNPAKLKNLKKLYIRGGRLTKIPYNDNWEVELLRLRFLTELKTDFEKLIGSYKNLTYVEYVECPKLENFPEGRNRWIKDMDEQF